MATVQGVAKSRTQLSDFTFTFTFQMAKLLWVEGKLKFESEVAQLCLTLCDPMDCSLPGSSFHRIFQARILEWIAVSFSRRSS